MIDLSLGGGSISNYYKDDSSPDSGDTGDQKSYGDSGIVASNPSGELSFTMENYILPASQPNIGATYQRYKDNPLQLNLSDQNYDCKPYDANITAPVSARVHEEVKFEASIGKGKEPFTYNWDFGDGSSASENPGIHTFDDCAEFTVNLNVSNACGSADAPGHTIKVEGCQQSAVEQFYPPLVNKTDN